MISDRETFLFYASNISIILLKYYVLIHYRFVGSFKALINRGAQVLLRQDAFEKISPTALAEKNKNNKPASTSGNTSAASPPSSSSSYVSAASSPKSNSSHESLSTTLHRVRMQSNVALADLWDKVDDLKQENEDLKAYITTSQTASRAMKNRIDILERYVQKDINAEDTRDRELNDVKEFAQQIVASINSRIDIIQEQQLESEGDFQAKLMDLLKKSNVLRARYNELKVELDRQSKLREEQAQQIEANTNKIEYALASDALKKLVDDIHDLMIGHESDLKQLASEHRKVKTVANESDATIKTLINAVVGLEDECSQLRTKVDELSNMELRLLDVMAEDVHKANQETMAYIQENLGGGNPDTQYNTTDLTDDGLS
ncbi:hypothetical protein MBANPS3_004703 [Mucor bainieri]